MIVMPRGKVEWFDVDKGYGAIRPDQSEESLFVHESTIMTDGKTELKALQTVYFEIFDGMNGRQAIEVRPVDLSESPSP